MVGLLEQLRSAADVWGRDDGGDLYAAAADEIEYLRAELSFVRGLVNQEQPKAVVRSVTNDEVRVKWLAGFPQIGDRLY